MDKLSGIRSRWVASLGAVWRRRVTKGVTVGVVALLLWPAAGAFANIRDLTISQDQVPTVAPGDTTTVTLTLTNPANGDTSTYNKMYIFKAPDTTFVNLTLGVTDSQSNSVSFNCFDFDAISWRCEPNGGTPILRQGETYTASVGGIQLDNGVADGTTVQAGRVNVHFDTADNGQGVFPDAPSNGGPGPFPFSVTAGSAPPSSTTTTTTMSTTTTALPTTTTTTAPPAPPRACRFIYLDLLGLIRICI